MSDIQSLIKMLQSDNHNKRYDACEELRVLPSLPPEVLEALRLVANDANPSVADAAQRAITLHTPKKTLDVVQGLDVVQSKENIHAERQGIRYFFAIGSGVLFIIDSVLLGVNFSYLNLLCPITFSFVVTAIVTAISKSTNVAIVAIIVFLVAIMIGFMLLSFSGGFYM